MAYSRVRGGDLEIQVLLGQTPSSVEDSISLGELLHEISNKNDTSMVAFTAAKGVFLIHSVSVPEQSANTIEDARQTIAEFIRSRERSRNVLFSLQSEYDSGEPEKSPGTNRLVIIDRWDHRSRGNFAFSTNETEILDVHLPESRKSLLKSLLGKRRHFTFAGVLALALLAVLFMFSPRTAMEKAWMRYDTRGSKGPKYQLQFTHHNVSEWAENNPHSNGEWALRIDDQAMIPAHLLDDEERRYQKWYQERYPEMNEVRTKQLYIDEGFLGDPMAIQVKSDKTFHMSHCVRALRRYWQAKETGKHVCPRDIDYRHIKHCLDSLDGWAFPEGKRLENQGGMEQEEDNWVLIWETKVCYD
ncbi:MAG: hypothetical protein MMC23_004634 [Stictis urceolatum]|nr:hypothetical protein [Stictis urceolata]